MSTRHRRVTAFTGSGISADSGIPTFRATDGLWEAYDIEDVATIAGFEKNPALVWEFYKKRHHQITECSANAAHHALVTLERYLGGIGWEFKIITQNVDGLHQHAGSTSVGELHGSLHKVKCSNCDFTSGHPVHWESNDVPLCPNCGDNLRPDVVWFGEILPQDVFSESLITMRQSDIILVIGTSCQVYPAAAMVLDAYKRGAKIIEFNLERSVIVKGNKVEFVRGRAKDTVPDKLLGLIEQINEMASEEVS